MQAKNHTQSFRHPYNRMSIRRAKDTEQPTEQGIGGACIHVVRENIGDDKKDLNDLHRGLRHVIQHAQALVGARHWAQISREVTLRWNDEPYTQEVSSRFSRDMSDNWHPEASTAKSRLRNAKSMPKGLTCPSTSGR